MVSPILTKKKCAPDINETVYPLTNTLWLANGTRDITIVVEVFSTPQKAFDYAKMLANTQIEYPSHIPDIDQNIPVRYEADFLFGYVRTLDVNGNVVDEYNIWYQEVK